MLLRRIRWRWFGTELLSSQVVGEVRQGNTVDDGFIEVGRSNRKLSNQNRAIVFAAGQTKGNLGTNPQRILRIKDTENITITNRFGSLEEDNDISLISESTNMSASNKEYILKGTMKQVAKSGAQVKGNLPSGPFATGKGTGPTTRSMERRVGNQKSMKRNGPNTKVKVNRPMRGLVFGPAREETQMSVSGKRLRVEQDGIGRAGGVFGNSNACDQPVEQSIPSISSDNEENQLGQEENRREQEDMAIVSPETVVELGTA